MSQSNKKGGFAALYDLQEKKRAEREKPTPVTPVTGVKDEAAPKRDFTRVANSVIRDAIPAGLFTGKGKQLYDYLYLQTRGAIVPVRSARLQTERVMKGAGMTRHTYRTHLERLMHAGLVQVEEKAGEHGGNIFIVFLPEEIGVERGDRGDRGDSCQKLPLVQGSIVDRGDRGLSADSSMIYGEPKTLIKTNTENDDEAYADFLRLVKETVKEITGKKSSVNEREKWRELAELLTTELKIAAARTQVSSAPAFLTEHLRRRLWKIDKRQLGEEGKRAASESKLAGQGKQARGCPDCGGTGFYYPEGFEGGVARCRHEQSGKA